MKDRLEEFVRNHRDEFDLFEPSDELWEKIERSRTKSSKKRINFYLSRVAAVAAIFIVSFAIQQYFFRIKQSEEIPELREAEMYYTGLINSKLEEVKPLLMNYPDVEADLEHDLSELDSIYKDLRHDLKDNIANQEVIEAMIDNYRLRIDILEEMLNFLEENELDNNKNHSEYEL